MENTQIIKSLERELEEINKRVALALSVIRSLSKEASPRQNDAVKVGRFTIK